jgi:hypothetical protein
MLDVIGGISLTALFALCCGVLIARSPLAASARVRLAIIAVLWFTGVGVFAGVGLFSAAGAGTPAIGAALLAPIVVSLWAARRSPAVRALAFGIPLSVLVALHAGRILGVFFLMLLMAGRLPATFALAAGWGDILVAAAALPLAWAIHRQASGWRRLTFAWNVFGFMDLVTAVTLGVGSASDSPARFLFETPASDAMGFLPWVLVPAVMVPLYLLIHIATFARLAHDDVRVPVAGSPNDPEEDGPRRTRRAAAVHGGSTLEMS